MSGIHRRRPAPIEDADFQTGEAIFTTTGDPSAGPRCFRLDVSPREEDPVTKVSRSLIGAERRDSVSPSIAESWVAVDPLSSKTARTRRSFRRAAGPSASARTSSDPSTRCCTIHKCWSENSRLRSREMSRRSVPDLSPARVSSRDRAHLAGRSYHIRLLLG